MIYLILFLAFILRLINISQSLWLDEAAQVLESQYPVPTIIQNMAADFHPPLFHILFHFWLYLGTQEWIMRLFPIILGLASIYLTYLLTKKLFNQKVGLIAALLLSINPFHINFSQELRPYVLGCLIGVAVVYTFWQALEKKSYKYWVLFIVINTLFIYTTYLAIFLNLGLILFFGLNFKKYKEMWIKVLGAFFVSYLLFLPWVPTIFNQLAISSGISRDLIGWNNAVSTPAIKALPLTLIKFIIGQIEFNPPLFYFSITSILLILWGVVIYKGVDFKNSSWKFIGIIFSSTLISSVLFSFFLQIVAPKRVIFLLPLLIVLLSAGLIRFSSKFFKCTLILLIILNGIFVFIYETNPYFQREDWRKSIVKINSLADDHSAVVFKFSAPFAPYSWYQKKDIMSYNLAPRLQVTEESFDVNTEGIENKNSLFVYRYLGDLSDPNRITEMKLNELNFSKKDTFDFPGVGLVDYYVK